MRRLHDLRAVAIPMMISNTLWSCQDAIQTVDQPASATQHRSAHRSARGLDNDRVRGRQLLMMPQEQELARIADPAEVDDHDAVL